MFFTRFIAFQAPMVNIVFMLFLYPLLTIWPYKIDSINRLVVGTTLSSSLILTAGIMFYIQEFKSEYQLNMLGYFVILVIVGTSTLIVCFLVSHLRFLYVQYQEQRRPKVQKT